MKIANHYFILIVVNTILAVPALADVEPTFLEEPDSILIGRAHPELAIMEKVHFSIISHGAEPDKDGLLWKELQAKVESKLEEAGIKITRVNFNPGDVLIPQLQVCVDMLKLRDLQQFVFRIQISLARTVALWARPNLHFQADVWKTQSLLQAASAENISPAITKVVLGQVDDFITDYLAAYVQYRRTVDANDITAVVPPIAGKQTKPPVKIPKGEHKFLASKNSKVFHKADCQWAERIKPANLVIYSTRAEAVEAGKRPCKRCKP